MRWQRAFTTTELLAVMMLAGIVAALAAPHLGRWLTAMRLNAAARQLASDLQLSRMRAVARNTPFQIRFDVERDAYTVEQEGDGGTWQVLDHVRLPPGIDLLAATTNPVRFQPLGTVAAGTTITLKNPRGERQVRVSFGGRIHVE
ncbi:MAG: hypothetical protein KatS3mg131_1879 [Candidatus Tectimicrobiota bacterium]|nr:MAG: hypothetical protein KatS3mg131_1879 [Candidatus Tectomicrobia bacterium]